MTELLRYHAADELQALSLGELQALWELVPTDRQRRYKQAYERELRAANATGSDVLEGQVAAELLRRYSDDALVPVGMRWARTPTRVQDAARKDEPLDPTDDSGNTASKLSPKVVLGAGVAALIVLFVLFSGMFSGGGGKFTAIAEATDEPSPTPTLEATYPPTPLALDAQDDIIREGDDTRAASYPIQLQIDTGDSPPRVFVVQRRAVRTSEWSYDSNPDTASFLSGMAVRPVIGIPWSVDNAAWFNAVGQGTTFTLQMNTGAALRFEFSARTDVRRSDTNIFRQIGPGLVLLLIGETDANGLPTATRTLVTATYPPEQELSRTGELTGLNSITQTGEMGDMLPLGEASIVLRRVSARTDVPELPADQQAVIVDFEVTGGQEDIDTTLWRIELVDETGQVYLPAAVNGDYAPLPTMLPALSVLPVSIGYIVPNNVRSGHWVLTDPDGSSVSFQFALQSRTPQTDARFDGVDVRLVSVLYQPGQITTLLRIYNGGQETLYITQDDIWLALGYAPQPPGPRTPAEGLIPFDLLPEQAVDLTLVWYWAAEPYAALGIGEYLFAVQLTR